MVRFAPLLVVLLVAAADRPALAGEEWRYCVAQDELQHRFYITEAFSTEKGIDVLERQFNDYLDNAGLTHRWGICPRSPTPFEAAADVESATRYNRKLGLEPHPVDWPDTRS